jgi:hypothetical protein
MAEAYYIDGTDLSRFMTIQRVDATAHGPSMLQEDYLVPGRTGALAVQPWFGPATISIGGTISDTTRPRYLRKLHNFMSLCVNSGLPFEMKRVLRFPGQDEVNVAEARYVGGLDVIGHVSPRAGRVMAEFSLLSGFWTDPEYISTKRQTDTFAVRAPGDVATNDLVIILRNGTNQRVTNRRTGDWVQYNGNTSTSNPAVLTVKDFTAVRNDNQNVIANVTSRPRNSSKYWLTLTPEQNNRITLSGGGSVEILYKGFHL